MREKPEHFYTSYRCAGSLGGQHDFSAGILLRITSLEENRYIQITVKGGGPMFKMTGAAADKLLEAVEKERKTEDEKLYVRLSMGIG
ncbi:hypothetical protein NKS29_11400 [Bacillus infantis]|nr:MULTISPECIES: hypothetical protein [Bacillus]MCP1158381.1 hypothetical protein [Bacillus infantis]MDT0159029.1 hypothetical protein [Bacillus sp. AG4(2022)]